ncbi:uncharacterized protein PAC_14352 [Phialocephala subalpina]|uniref:ABM domain-containing protein n=1 Tax=Phialocephala subalpina TaxID=576137 RepID=A0A1L7XHF1_9HELO|nr:uncharacterized protein PAC_14352 [Phialocephala subalpina]
MAAKQALQVISIPHRPVPDNAEINKDLAPAFEILKQSPGLLAIWRGRKYEDRFTEIAILLWSSLASSHAFFTSHAYATFHKDLQPAMNGRHITWQNHALLSTSELDDVAHLKAILNSPAIEVALTKVVEGGVAGYYEQFRKVVVPILNEDQGCDGHFISPLIENPQDQLLLINWKSVDAHHEEFERRPTFKACIDALFEYYKEFVVPWHIVELQLVHGSL